MRVLVVAATDAEMAALGSLGRGADALVTGVGMVGTAARVARALAIDQYDAALNIGVCGSFNPAFPPGAVVHVVTDRIAELGAEDGDHFLTLDDLALTGDQAFTSRRQPVSPTLAALPRVTAITMNTAHGNEASLARAVERFRPDVESMEGAGFMCACTVSNVPYAQIRAVSNVVERRNRQAWKMADAIESLGRTARAILSEL